MHLSQIRTSAGAQCVVARHGSDARIVNDCSSTYDLAKEAVASGVTLAQLVTKKGLGEAVDLREVASEGRFLAPFAHPDQAHTILAGTGLTHLGSASARDAMHASVDESEMTDSMKMFQMGLKDGKPQPGQHGVQPEWFYKGTGEGLVASGQDLVSPSFALDGGEEPEIAGIYINDAQGEPHRVGFALSNEFSDHVTERQNYLYLAHSKLRQASVGPEMLVGDLPDDVQGMSRILRDGEVIWEKPFLSGETNMSHTIANLEYHHFKYDVFRQPDDVNIHFFGTATLSVADGIVPEEGDVFEIAVEDFGQPLRNALKIAAERPVSIKKL